MPRGVAQTQHKKVTTDILPITHDLLRVWDIASVIASAYLFSVIYNAFGPTRPLSLDFSTEAGTVMLVGSLLAPFVLTDRSLFSFAQLGRVVPVASATAIRTSVLLAMILAFAFLSRNFSVLPRTWVLAWSCGILACAVGGRLALGRYLSKLERQGTLRDRVAIVGAPPTRDRLLAYLRSAKPRGIDVVSVFDAGQEALDTLVALGKSERLDTIVVALPEGDTWRVAQVTRELKALDVDIALCPHQFASDLPLGRTREVAGTPMWLLAHRPIQRWGMVHKAVEDRVLGAVLLVFLLPLLLATAAAICVESRGPILFRQKRHGWNNTEFEVFKFRTMRWSPSLPTGGADQTLRGDRRVTRVGRFLRKFSLDELPQLINVLRGDMSLVGPRPHPVVMRTETRLGHEIVAEYAHRHRVKPGITGWAQVNGYRGATATAAQVQKRIEHDIYYIENWSVMFDLKILALTPLKLLFDTDNAF